MLKHNKKTMKKRAFLISIIIQLLLVAWVIADPSSVDPVEKPPGEPIRVEVMVVLALVAFALFKIFGVGKTKELPPPKPPRPKPLLKQVHEAIGGMEEVGDKTFVGGKLVASKRDVETYLMMAQVDKSHIRKQERAIAQAEYQNYERKLFYLKVAVGLFTILLLAITHETLIEWGKGAYSFISGLFASSGTQ